LAGLRFIPSTPVSFGNVILSPFDWAQDRPRERFLASTQYGVEGRRWRLKKSRKAPKILTGFRKLEVRVQPPANEEEVGKGGYGEKGDMDKKE
jgi:hypothetical protein